jgi:hypothetical protein
MMSGFGGGGSSGMVPPTIPNPSYIDPEAFADVGQALWTLFLSWLGGTVVLGLFRKKGMADRVAAT